MRKTMLFLAAISVFSGIGSGFAQIRMSNGGFVAGGGLMGPSTNNNLVGYVGGGMFGKSSSLNHELQGGQPLYLAAGVAFPTNLSTAPIAMGMDYLLNITPAAAAPDAVLAFYYRVGGSQGSYTGPVAMTLAGSTFTGTIPAASIGIRGLEVYVEGVQNGLTTSLGSPSTPARLRTALNSYNSPTQLGVTYKMIGFPYAVSPSSVAAVFEDDLGSPDNTKWKLGRWSGTTYLEYSAVGSIKAGDGYWLASRHVSTVDASGVSTVPTTTRGAVEYAAIELHSGWNQISVPFGFDVNWADCLTEPNAGSVENVLHDYTGAASQYDQVTVMKPFIGYWANNTSGSSQTLLVPYVENVAKSSPGAEGPVAKAATAADWRVSLELVAPQMKDDSLTLGVFAGSGDGIDAADYSQPPYPEGKFLALSSLVASDDGEIQHDLVGDFRRPDAEGWRFTVRARGNTTGVTHLRLASASSLPTSFAVALVDPATGSKYDLSGIGDMVLPETISPQGTEYQVLVGEKAWIEEQAGDDAVIPLAFRLGQNYPNPFNPQTTIQFELPVPGHVKLEIFDIRGRLVTTVSDRQYRAGVHKEIWTGVNNTGRPVATGVYFYRITSNQAVDTKRMLLLK